MFKKPQKLILFLTAFISSVAFADLPQQSLRPGGIAIIPVETNITKAELKGQRVPIVSEQNKRYAIVGIPLDQTPGQIDIQLTSSGRFKTEQIKNQPIFVKEWPYREQHLTIKDQSRVTPDESQLARFTQEAAEQKAIYQSFLEKAESAFPNFIVPVAGVKTATFGSRRFFNGEARAPHSGMDIKAAEGKSVISPADGIVRKTGDYFFNGRTVIIDHGQGIYSMLCHLSDIAAQEGQKLKQGDVIGKVGHTGRATGPHLHWTVSINDARVDPALLLK